MSRPYVSLKHVETMALLPKKLMPGRLYFIDDEQVIVIDHGDGYPPVIYGGKPGPMGPSGEPQPQLQDQIDTLAQTELKMQSIMWEEMKYVRDTVSRLTNHFSETLELLRGMADTNAQSIMTLSATIKKSCDGYDSAIATLTRAITNLYPDGKWHDDSDPDPSDEPAPAPAVLAQTLTAGSDVKFSGANLRVLAADNNGGSLNITLQNQGDFSDKSDPLDNETISTSAGSWVIQQSNMYDGSTVLSLTARPTVLDSLSEGDKLSAGKDTYTVSHINRPEDGTISLTLH